MESYLQLHTELEERRAAVQQCIEEDGSHHAYSTTPRCGRPRGSFRRRSNLPTQIAEAEYDRSLLRVNMYMQDDAT